MRLSRANQDSLASRSSQPSDSPGMNAGGGGFSGLTRSLALRIAADLKSGAGASQSRSFQGRGRGIASANGLTASASSIFNPRFSDKHFSSSRASFTREETKRKLTMKIVRMAIGRPVTTTVIFDRGRPAGIRLPPPAERRPPAQHQLSAPLGRDPVSGRRPRRDGNADHGPSRGGRQPRPGPAPRGVGFQGGRLRYDPRVRLGHGHGFHHAPYPGGPRRRPRRPPRGRR